MPPRFEGGTFSGSFQGDGSSLTGVTAEIANPLVDGAGVANFVYSGSAGQTASLDLAPKGGLTFYNSSNTGISRTFDFQAVGHGLKS